MAAWHEWNMSRNHWSHVNKSWTPFQDAFDLLTPCQGVNDKERDPSLSLPHSPNRNRMKNIFNWLICVCVCNSKPILKLLRTVERKNRWILVQIGFISFDAVVWEKTCTHKFNNGMTKTRRILGKLRICSFWANFSFFLFPK